MMFHALLNSSFLLGISIKHTDQSNKQDQQDVSDPEITLRKASRSTSRPLRKRRALSRAGCFSFPLKLLSRSFFCCTARFSEHLLNPNLEVKSQLVLKAFYMTTQTQSECLTRLKRKPPHISSSEF